MTIRILIAEDQRLLRQCFCEALGAEPDIEVIATAADGNEALLLVERHQPDMVLMDLAMPNLDGAKAAKLIRQRFPDTKILMLSLHDEPAKVTSAMKAGVAGFVSKDVDFGELVRIIRAVRDGKEIRSPFLADQRLAQDSDISKYDLTDREVQALRLLVQGYNNSEIAEMLCVSEQTIKKEFVTIFERLGVRNRTQAAVKGVQLGLLAGQT
jgi:DNA-binding NarL/FixJ family response regulator